MNVDLLSSDLAQLFPFMETILQDGGKSSYSLSGTITPFRNRDGYSGFDYDNDTIVAVGLILGGSGYVVRRQMGSELSRFDYFDLNGNFTFSSQEEGLKALIVDFHQMDLTCPILNHFYNYLSLEYKNAAEGKSQTAMVHSVEKLLKRAYKSKKVRVAIKDGAKDPAVTNIYNKILKAEMDPVLTWEERHLVFNEHKQELNLILATKIRAHKLNNSKIKLALMGKNFSNFTDRFFARPISNSKGLIYRYTIGKVLWFFNTVKDNLGYSVALAVYGPFTYYFITMPMNPHAMQAVGRVRSVYLDARTQISSIVDRGSELMDQSSEAVAAPATTTATATNISTVSDTVSTTAAAPIVNIATSPEALALANVVYPSRVTMGPVETVTVDLGDGAKKSFQPTTMNMLMSTDVDQVNKTSWTERMSNFKQMQIAYEENIEYASRMGRLEQLETQYNFPMQMESTWEELERYNTLIFKLREENPNLSAKMKQYLFNEISRTQQLELYLWDRMARFILDQIYVMLDQDKEQKRSDYYVGRSFIFMEEMTNILSWRYKNFKKPEGYDRIEKLSAFYKAARKEQGTIMKNLQVNSDLFKQKDVYDTKEFRKYMKRQWEILFLQNAKAEEASNNGLNMYIWSVRNTAWILQSVYSAKREELAILINRDVSGKLLTPAEMMSRSKITMMYETLFHNLTLEYVGIREEIMNRLGKDIESTQRVMVLDNLKEFFTDREKLDGMAGIAAQKSAGTKL